MAATDGWVGPADPGTGGRKHRTEFPSHLTGMGQYRDGEKDLRAKRMAMAELPAVEGTFFD